MSFTLNGEGIVIRNAEPEDQEKIGDLLKTTNCSLMMLGAHPERLHVYHPREDLFPEQIEEGKVYRLMVLNNVGDVMGYVGLKLTNREFKRAELSYFIGDRYSGHGYATRALSLLTQYALSELGLVRVYLEITEENLPSLRVAEKAGFIREGLLMKYKKIGNKWHNYWLLAIISSEANDK